MFKPKVSGLETENKKLKSENETLKRENAELRQTVDKLKQSLEEAVRGTKPQPGQRVQKPTTSQSQASSETADHELRKLIKDLQDRLTIAEQVTAATQRRELEQEGAYENLPTTGVYEELRFDQTQEHVYAKLQLPTHTGCICLQ